MAAFNYIRLPDGCPKCGARQLVLQCHAAASFNGDKSGRFCMRYYYVGDRLPWFGEKHRAFATLFDHPAVERLADDAAREDCWGYCQACKHEVEGEISLRESLIVSAMLRV